MSVLLIGIEMPEEGNWRSVRIYPDGTIGRPIGFGDYALVEGAKAIPAADVRPVVRARWVKMKFFPDWECERCGSVISGNTPDPWNHYHFCPNCGADMRIFSTNCKNTVTTGGKT